MIQISGKMSKPFWSMRSGRVTKIHLSLLSALQKRKTKGHWEYHEHLILGANSVTVSYLIHNGSLLQNATDIIEKYVA